MALPVDGLLPVAFCAYGSCGGDAQDAKLGMVLIVLARIYRAGVEEDLPVDPFDGLMMGVAKDDHISIGIVLGEVLMIAFKKIAITQGEVFVEQVVPHGPVTVAEDDPDAVRSELHMPRKALSQQPISIALDDGEGGDFLQGADWFVGGSIACVQNVIHLGICQATQDGCRQVFCPIRDEGV